MTETASTKQGYSNITIIGNGAMGTVCAMLLASKGFAVKLWGHSQSEINEIINAGENTIYLPGYKITPTINLTSEDTSCMQDADLVVSAVPCQFIRNVWQRLAPHIPADIPIVSVAKGIENSSMLLPTEVIESLLGKNHIYAALSGPNIADELVRKLPATACIACKNPTVGKKIQHTFSTNTFRVYYNDDLKGVQLAGALKNVIAIAAGIIDGIKAGDNAKAALLARGLAEITRLGEALGAKTQTFAGLAGLGDLVTTCISPKGRNRSFGEKIGKGIDTAAALKSTNSVIEGVATCRSVIELAHHRGVEMPICEAVYCVIEGKKSVKEAITDLMTRDLKQE